MSIKFLMRNDIVGYCALYVAWGMLWLAALSVPMLVFQTYLDSGFPIAEAGIAGSYVWLISMCAVRPYTAAISARLQQRQDQH